MLSSLSQLFAVDYTYTTVTGEETTASGGAAVFIIILYVAIAVLLLAAMWKVFKKAGKPGWAAIIPIYNTIVMLQIIGRPIWWFLLMLIPFVNLIVLVIVYHEFSKSFGKGVGMTLLLIFLPFIGWPMLGFGDAKYQRLPGR